MIYFNLKAKTIFNITNSKYKKSLSNFISALKRFIIPKSKTKRGYKPTY